jgi:putative hydrolase of the HAD superfamily
MGGIRAIIFDLDNTLWDVWPVIVREHAMHDFLTLHYPRVTELHDLRSMRDVRARMVIEHPAMRHDFTWLRLESLRHHAREVAYPESMADQAFEAFYRARNEVTLYDDVRPALAGLAKAYRLFALSNGNADLELCGISQYFETGLAAREAGMLSPIPGSSRSCSRVGLAAHEVVHVGDDAEADVEGARGGRAAGLVEPRSDGMATGIGAPELTILRGLDELAAALARAVQARAST